MTALIIYLIGGEYGLFAAFFVLYIFGVGIVSILLIPFILGQIVN